MKLSRHFKSVSHIALGTVLSFGADEIPVQAATPTAENLSAMCLEEPKPYRHTEHFIGVDEVHLSGKMGKADNFRPMTPKIKVEMSEAFRLGSLDMVFSGAVEAVGPQAHKPPRIMIEPHLWWQVGETSKGAGNVMLGTGVEIWHNKYGRYGAYDIVPEIGLKIKF